jgi:hypothetical protein
VRGLCFNRWLSLRTFFSDLQVTGSQPHAHPGASSHKHRAEETEVKVDAPASKQNNNEDEGCEIAQK